MRLLFGLGETCNWRRRGILGQSKQPKRLKRPPRPIPVDFQVDPSLRKCRPTIVEPGRSKVDVLAARYANGQEMWHPDDEGSLPLDAVQAFLAMSLAFFSGVEKRHESSWRANPWNGRAGRHEHLGYFRRQEEAIAAVRMWRDRLGDDDVRNERRSAWLDRDED